MTRPTRILFLGFSGTLAAAALASFAAPPARADYAVLRSGARLHITGYEKSGDTIKLNFDGGSAQIPATDLMAVEPEEQFQAVPAPPAAPGADLSEPYADLIHASATKNGVDEKLVRQVIAQESNFNPRAVSRKNAQGLMQLLPETAARYSVANIFDPAENIEAGVHYLKDLLARYSGDVKLALAAYNAGPDMVDRYAGIPPFPETQKYVSRITANLAREAAHGGQ
jgi:soluble lytic murein transglycosylase-like protein